MTKYGKLVYWTVWLVLKIMALLYLRLSVRGASAMPKSGPVVVVVNHSSHLDPPLVGVAFRQRALCYMAKRELWEGPILRWFLNQIAAIPVAREAAADRKTFMTAVDRLRKGHAVLLFPEGTRSKTGEMQEFQVGASALAASVPGTLILPVRVHGSYEAMPPGVSLIRPRKVRVHVGKPFRIEDLEGLPQEKKALYRAVADQMFDRISKL